MPHSFSTAISQSSANIARFPSSDVATPNFSPSVESLIYVPPIQPPGGPYPTAIETAFPMAASDSSPDRVTICGGGVIGASIAYFLTLRGLKPTVIERAGVANAASGKSGGFLALDWNRGTPVDALARRSFALHAELAGRLQKEMGLNWGYRLLETLSVAASTERDFSSIARLPSPNWLVDRAAVHAKIGTVETTAQIHPAQFTRGLMKAAEAGGARLISGEVEGIELAEDGRRVTGVVVDGDAEAADAIVIAMGPWSILACNWLPLPAIYGLKGHSLVFRYSPPDPQALFVELETSNGEIHTPEVFPRDDGTTYVCGLSGQAPLPVDPAQVTEDPGASDKLRRLTAAFSPALGASEIVASQACYRPITQDGIPVIGRVPGVSGAYIATGHSVWGMLNGPATGEGMAELIVDGAASTVDISPFDPGRLDVFSSV